ncbi:response regulator [Pontimicrobium aquaticum]|uniref:Response regulator transcription factor n=1 Tax=Pontimicrobium aquaticum TaxID=2565367 RepID=A0A4U0EZZ8_9FLAO|nr:response regulator transcription factor [Pontimicrobium aquaticum]TJY37695.1 response regulator transcription factor [Pontimicrobium aquaticum]
MVVNTLIIEDHPIIVEVNEIALDEISKDNRNYNFVIQKAKNADEALNIINDPINDNKLNLVFLDIRINPSKDETVLSGEDLGLLLRNKFDNIKIIVITSFNNNFRLNSILNNLDPDGLMVKTNLTSQSLKTAIETVLKGETYYCNTVSKLLRTLIKNDIVIDDLDRGILYQLSIGTKMKDIPKILPLSMGSVEHRKRKLYEAFNLSSRNDRMLILKAKEKGFI